MVEATAEIFKHMTKH